MTPKLAVKFEPFSDAELRAWRKGRLSLIRHCSKPLKRILRKKARARPGRRFFGEAKVAASVRHSEGCYGSFKWLTSPKWCGHQKLRDRYEAEFRDALTEHFPELRQFQQLAERSMRALGGRKPVGPDLWLITPSRHRFIEVKLPGDRLGRHQLIGLALIATFLRSDRPVSVEIWHLHNGPKPEISSEFRQKCEAIKKQLRGTRSQKRVHGPTTRWSRRRVN